MAKKIRVAPNCCEESLKHKSVFLDAPEEAYEGRVDILPVWKTKGIRDKNYNSEFLAKFCPYCGKSLPEIELSNTDVKVIQISDGGNYCDTCNERANFCSCYPVEVKWKCK